MVHLKASFHVCQAFFSPLDCHLDVCDWLSRVYKRRFATVASESQTRIAQRASMHDIRKEMSYPTVKRAFLDWVDRCELVMRPAPGWPSSNAVEWNFQLTKQCVKWSPWSKLTKSHWENCGGRRHLYVVNWRRLRVHVKTDKARLVKTLTKPLFASVSQIKILR